MTAWWAIYANGERRSECIEASSQQEAIAIAVATHGMKPVKIDRIPYPANPRLNEVPVKFADGRETVTPSFCSSPERCAGHGACPHRYSCVD